MTPEEQITKMKKAITQALKVMGDRFGSTEADVARAMEELKASCRQLQPQRLSLLRPRLLRAPVHRVCASRVSRTIMVVSDWLAGGCAITVLATGDSSSINRC